MKYNVNSSGFYGDFGGAYIPEMLFSNIDELKNNYLSIVEKDSFIKEFNYYLKKYVGRPTPLYYAKRLSKKYRSKIYLKREDLCHTGAHKINNTIGQYYWLENSKKQKLLQKQVRVNMVSQLLLFVL